MLTTAAAVTLLSAVSSATLVNGAAVVERQTESDACYTVHSGYFGGFSTGTFSA